MEHLNNTQPSQASNGHPVSRIEVADTELVFRPVDLSDDTPTGSQIAAAAGFKPGQRAIVLHFLDSGELEDLRPQEIAKLKPDAINRFIVVESDRSYRLTIDGVALEWPCSIISGAQIRRLGSIAPSKAVLLERQEDADMEVADGQLVSLDAKGVEAFYAKERKWTLKVQDIDLEYTQPHAVVRDAIQRAGFDANQEWHIFLKVVGQPKKSVTLDYVIDLRTKGIEKLRLTPKDINNGEAPPEGRRAFALQPVDESFLNRVYCAWEAVRDGANQWLLIHNYPVPAGYNRARVTLALQVPANYPAAQIDMFFVNEPLALLNGVELAATQHHELILGKNFQRWSRHRAGATQWKPMTDNVITHLALVDDCLAREVGE